MDRPRTVLIIEDDPQVCMTMTAYLEDSGYTVLKAADGIEGLEVFARARPDIILTDLRMPRLDGYGVITAVKAQSPGTPVIAFTGTGDPLAADNALRLGASECLFKPIEDLGLLEAAIIKAFGAGGQT
jgi:sigma-B regulation protein RsbU (phosphoserine phosphatase)